MWLSETLPLSLSSAAAVAAVPFRGSLLDSALPFLGGGKRIRFGDGDRDGGTAAKGGRGAGVPGMAGGDGSMTGVPTKEELLAVMERFEER